MHPGVSTTFTIIFPSFALYKKCQTRDLIIKMDAALFILRGCHKNHPFLPPFSSSKSTRFGSRNPIFLRFSISSYNNRKNHRGPSNPAAGKRTTRHPLLAASAAARGSPSTPTAPEDTQAEGATPGGAGRARSSAPQRGQGLPPATATAGLRPALAPQHGGASGAAPARLPAPHRPYLPPSRRSAGERGAPQRLPMRPPPRRGRLAGPPPRPGGEGRGPFPQRRRRRRASGSSGGRPPPGAQRRPAALRRLARVKRRRRQRRWSWGARAPGGR